MSGQHDMANNRSLENPLSPIAESPVTISRQPSNHEQGLQVAMDFGEKEAVQPGLQTVMPYNDRIGEKLWISELAPSYPVSKKRNRRWLIVGIVAIVLVAVILGAVLGVSFKITSQQVSTIQQIATPAATPSSTPTTVGLPSVELLTDTSIAAFEDSEGRHVFFQAINGSVQHAVYSSEWVVEDLGLPNIRVRTPLSALAAPDGTIYLFYVTTDNDLTSTRKSSGAWQLFSISGTLPLDSETRQLTANYVPSFQGDTLGFQLLILTAFSGEGMSAAYLSTQSTQSFFQASVITRDINLGAAFNFNVPCATASNVTGAGTQRETFLPNGIFFPWVAVCSEFPGNPTSNLIGISYTGEQFNSSLFNTSSASPIPVSPSPVDLEIAFINNQLSILHVGHDELISSGGSIPSDSSTYTYTRLGTFVSSDNLFYVYHQLDASTITEAVYNPAGHSWNSSNITIKA